MNKANLTSKVVYFNQLALALLLFSAPLAGTYAACCSGHGGVNECNKSTGYQMCKDGTASPTCTCAISKTTNDKGCCSNHGGVVQCNKATGHQMCKDGTASATCTCQ